MSSTALVRTIISTLLLGLGTWIVGVNLTIFWFAAVRRKHTSSVTPFLGAALVGAGLLLLPLSNTSRWWWIPFVVDWGSLPVVVASVIWWIARRKKEHPSQGVQKE